MKSVRENSCERYISIRQAAFDLRSYNTILEMLSFTFHFAHVREIEFLSQTVLKLSAAIINARRFKEKYICIHHCVYVCNDTVVYGI